MNIDAEVLGLPSRLVNYYDMVRLCFKPCHSLMVKEIALLLKERIKRKEREREQRYCTIITSAKGPPPTCNGSLLRERINKGNGERMKWISVKDRLPEDDKYVLVCNNKYSKEDHEIEILKIEMIDGKRVWSGSEDWPISYWDLDMYAYWLPIPEFPSDDVNKGD